MNRDQIIRAWKDEEYHSGLSESEQSLLPAHPAVVIELDSAEMEEVGGQTPGITTFPTWMTVCYVCPLPGDSLDFYCQYTINRCR